MSELKISPKVSEAAREDILDLQQKINHFEAGQEDEDRFKAFRLTRGVYGQRQLGVQMVRIKIPYGRISGKQLIRVADVSNEYTPGNLHITTRQDIQIHHVKLKDSPEIWAKLEDSGITLKEACGNTVRNVTASPFAGIDPKEPFDVTPYAHASFEYFLRNPICQEMGRKVKIAFSSNDEDAAFAYIHDFGMIPKVKKGPDGEELRGFKVLIGGGLGAQAFFAPTAYEFLPEDQLIPFMEAAIRVFDRYGEREKRHKARMKFLINERTGVGFEKFMELVEEQRTVLPHKTYKVDLNLANDLGAPTPKEIPAYEIKDEAKYNRWLASNVSEQKQQGYFVIKAKIPLGDIHYDKAKALVAAIDGFVSDDYRLTVNQGIVFRYATKEVLPYLFSVLEGLGMGDVGFDTIADITACPGTDTCNLGVTNSTDISVVLEQMLEKEYPELIKDSDIRIKNSGCMNACGQHMIANIGFHGSSIKKGALVIPALQVVMGGGITPDGRQFIAEKVIKLPTKRIPQAVRDILEDYKKNGNAHKYFNDYFAEKGKRYFYDVLKPLADTENITEEELKDWGQDASYVQAIGVGECAGVVLDMIGTIINDSVEKIANAQRSISGKNYADGIYHSYGALVVSAKALLLSKDVKCNTHIGIINDFQTNFVETGNFEILSGFKDHVLEMNQNEPTEAFAVEYLERATKFVEAVQTYRAKQLEEDKSQKGKLVVDQFYKA